MNRRFISRMMGFVAILHVAGQVAAAASAPDPDQTAAAVDQLLADEVLQGQPAAPPANDETFFRRAAFDLVGDLPTPQQITAFALDPSPHKRTAAIDRLLAHEQYGQNWARYWRDVILSRRTEERALIVANPLVVHLTDELNKNTPWNELARQFITAAGDVREHGETAIFVAQEGLTEESTAEISRIFLGIQIQCAQCHDHVTDRWKREQFHQLAAFFPRVALRPSFGGDVRSFQIVGDDRPGGPVRKENGRRGVPEHYMPDLADPTASGQRMTPVFFLTGQSVPQGTPDAERRAAAARWITGDPWFAKAVVNRLWAELVGEGFYEPIDDLGPDRKVAAAPKTIDYLSQKFIDSGYDLKWLLRTIASTAAYQRESRPRHTSQSPPFAANCSQRLRADQLYNALTKVLEINELEGPGIAGRGGGMGSRGLFGPRGQFGLVFGYDPSASRDEVTGSIPQALAMMNNPQVQRHIQARGPSTMLGRLLQDERDDSAVVTDLYLRCVAREPRENELETCLAHVRATDNRNEAFEDILWALLNSTEFMHRR